MENLKAVERADRYGGSSITKIRKWREVLDSDSMSALFFVLRKSFLECIREENLNLFDAISKIGIVKSIFA